MSYFSFSDPPDPPTKLKVNLVTKNTVTLSWECPKNNGGSPVTHYIIERLCWDTSGKEKETWKQCNKRDVEELSFVVEDLKEVLLSFLHAVIISHQLHELTQQHRSPLSADLFLLLCVFAGWRI